MKLELGFFCDSATEQPDGKLNVGGIFHDLFAPGFPAVQKGMVLVLIIEWGRKDQGRYNLKAELIAPDESVVLTVDGHSEVDPRSEDRPPARTRLVMSMEEVIFPEAGRYHLRVMVKGQRFRGPSLHLVEVEAPESGPAGESPVPGGG